MYFVCMYILHALINQCFNLNQRKCCKFSLLTVKYLPKLCISIHTHTDIYIYIYIYSIVLNF